MTGHSIELLCLKNFLLYKMWLGFYVLIFLFTVFYFVNQAVNKFLT